MGPRLVPGVGCLFVSGVGGPSQKGLGPWRDVNSMPLFSQICRDSFACLAVHVVCLFGSRKRVCNLLRSKGNLHGSGALIAFEFRKNGSSTVFAVYGNV